MNIILIMTLSLLVLVSIIIINGSSIRRSVILNGAVSLLATLTFILLFAPDVALAEAVIGSTISTIVLLFAIRSLRVIHVSYNSNDFNYDQVQPIFSSVYSSEDYDVQFTSNTEIAGYNLIKYNHFDYYIYINKDRIMMFSRREGSDREKVIEKLKKETGKEVFEMFEFSNYKGDHDEK